MLHLVRVCKRKMNVQYCLGLCGLKKMKKNTEGKTKVILTFFFRNNANKAVFKKTTTTTS